MGPDGKQAVIANTNGVCVGNIGGAKGIIEPGAILLVAEKKDGDISFDTAYEKFGSTRWARCLCEKEVSG